MDVEAFPDFIKLNSIDRHRRPSMPQNRIANEEPTKSARPPGVTDMQNLEKRYPHITQKMADLSSLQLFRRFKRTRMRLILAKQDQVARLESELDKIDEEEPNEINLGCLREDRREERWKKLRELERALSEYDNLVEKAHWALSMPDVNEKQNQSLRHFVGDSGLISWKESEYTRQSTRELMYIGVVRDRGMEKITTVAKSIVEAMYGLYDKNMGE
ncbi:uncharacterized protein K452DRAFT_167207 [Aplosporella prunicola CBS 121167]|uniref:DUF6594 domain-containing protein n=1 Tax=Aplosporella prunicola CBS 121167 TaxID=1176127 RepID=A0A6A6BGQ8_9PEZI|nr:uncharacterized protein K452DRAFT_167207 [Aplosporella prunicola CBS 121167]KAF2143166.1 hypothetical protein K452DRAFT_167207 [Aplosporella prunicola CBS 121167]